ncbi:MAG: DUF1287 domain-containing protein [Hyphomicrobiaceae bacterium]
MSAVALAAGDDRISLALLLAPFLIVAFSLGGERALRQIIARAPQFIAAAQPPRSPAVAHPRVAPQPPVPVSHREPVAPLRSAPARHSAPQPALARPDVPLQSLPKLRLVELPPPLLPTLTRLALPPPVLPSLALLELPSPRLPVLALLPLPPPRLPPLARLEIAPPPLSSMATLAIPRPALPLLGLLKPPPRPLDARSHPSHVTQPTVCLAAGDVLRGRPTGPQLRSVPPYSPTAFGKALSDAARAQLGDLVIYNSKYMHIAYPMGDVPSLFGVCTDVIVRAYRQLGVDLQELIQQTHSGTGDRNIDHRRVEVVRRFLARHGRALPISDLAEAYEPGDIVTYYRPQNRSSTAHIAIVTDQLAPSGRPMIVHNRGWGPQLEDALFVDKITGHYRFTGLDMAAIGKVPLAHRRLAKEASITRAGRAPPTRQ